MVTFTVPSAQPGGSIIAKPCIFHRYDPPSFPSHSMCTGSPTGMKDTSVRKHTYVKVQATKTQVSSTVVIIWAVVTYAYMYWYNY